MEEVKPPAGNQPTTTSLPVAASTGPQIPPVSNVPKPVTPKIDVNSLKEKFNKLPKQTKLMVTVAAGLFLLLFVLAILSALFGKKQTIVVITPAPTPISVTPIPVVILNASHYATDSGVLKIESDLNGFQQQLNSADVKQGDLSIPSINYDVNFNQ